MFDGIVERAVVARARLEVVDACRHRTLHAERDVGVRRGDHEVDLVEDVGHRFVHRRAHRFDAGADLDVVQLLRHLEPERDLRREVVGAVGIQRRRGRRGSRPAPRAPTQARARAASPERRRARGRPARASARTGLHGACDDFGVDVRDAEIRADHRAPAAQVVRAEAGLPSVDARQAVRIARVEAVAHVEVARDVARPIARDNRSSPSANRGTPRDPSGSARTSSSDRGGR